MGDYSLQLQAVNRDSLLRCSTDYRAQNEPFFAQNDDYTGVFSGFSAILRPESGVIRAKI
jgi:hypothetical protein